MTATGRRAGAGNAALRGAALIFLAVVLGLGLLAKSIDDGGPLSTGTSSASRPRATVASTVPGGVTTTTAPTAHNPADVKTLALNGAGKVGLAKTAREQLQAAGFATLDPGNTKGSVTTSAVYFQPGFEADAGKIATQFGLPPATVVALPNPIPPALGDVKDAAVVVVIGPDAPLAGATTTTAASAN